MVSSKDALKLSLVEVPQNLWDDIIDHLSAEDFRGLSDAYQLMNRIRQHFDGPDETD